MVLGVVAVAVVYRARACHWYVGMLSIVCSCGSVVVSLCPWVGCASCVGMQFGVVALCVLALVGPCAWPPCVCACVCVVCGLICAHGLSRVCEAAPHSFSWLYVLPHTSGGSVLWRLCCPRLPCLGGHSVCVCAVVVVVVGGGVVVMCVVVAGVVVVVVAVVVVAVVVVVCRV